MRRRRHEEPAATNDSTPEAVKPAEVSVKDFLDQVAHNYTRLSVGENTPYEQHWRFGLEAPQSNPDVIKVLLHYEGKNPDDVWDKTKVTRTASFSLNTKTNAQHVENQGLINFMPEIIKFAWNGFTLGAACGLAHARVAKGVDRGAMLNRWVPMDGRNVINLMGNQWIITPQVRSDNELEFRVEARHQQGGRAILQANDRNQPTVTDITLQPPQLPLVVYRSAEYVVAGLTMAKSLALFERSQSKDAAVEAPETECSTSHVERIRKDDAPLQGNMR